MTRESSECEYRITRGTGNVFADLGFANAAQRQAKLRLVHVVNQLLESRNLSQPAAAILLGLKQSRVSALRRYKVAEFSVEALIDVLTALGQDVEIAIRRKPRSEKAGRITVRSLTVRRCDER